jgi:hypothetical protein
LIRADTLDVQHRLQTSLLLYRCCLSYPFVRKRHALADTRFACPSWPEGKWWPNYEFLLARGHNKFGLLVRIRLES